MFDDVTYLKLFVDKDELWDVCLRELYSKKISKKEAKKRIAYTVINGKLGKIPEGKGDTTLAICNTYSQFALKDWVSLYDEIKNTDKEIVALRKKLLSIEYLSPEQLLSDSRIIWTKNQLRQLWEMTDEEIYQEVSLYGLHVIEQYLLNSRKSYSRLKGRYHFIHSLHKFVKDNGIDLVKYKTSELNKINTIEYENG